MTKLADLRTIVKYSRGIPILDLTTPDDLVEVLADPGVQEALGAWEWNTDDTWQKEQFRSDEGVMVVVPLSKVEK